MAGLMLYLYEKGYRNFVFFVNRSNIIEKTKDNFLNAVSSKYLFAPNININGLTVNIVETENFQAEDKDSINIVFTTIQGLHFHLNNPRENTVTYDDIRNQKTVLISDESHHINVDTKKGKLTANEQLEKGKLGKNDYQNS